MLVTTSLSVRAISGCLFFIFFIILMPIITGPLLSFVFLIAASFVGECSRKCINPCWSALGASCGLPADFNKKPCQVDQPFVTSLQMWCLKYTDNSKAPRVLHKLHTVYPANVMHVGWNFFIFYFFVGKKNIQNVIWNLYSVKSHHLSLLLLFFRNKKDFKRKNF